MTRRLSYCLLDTSVMFERTDPNIQNMSTLIESHQWRIEAEWNGVSIGDVSLFLNRNYRNEELEPDWQWYGGIPYARIRCYRWSTENAESEPKPAKAGTKRQTGAATA